MSAGGESDDCDERVDARVCAHFFSETSLAARRDTRAVQPIDRFRILK
jgi:hypothetical protein